MKTWRAFMAKYNPSGDVTDAATVFAYGISMTMMQVLKQCNGDFSRANVMKQAESLHDVDIPILLPGIKISTSRHRPSPDQGDAIAALGRQDLGSLRRPDRRRDDLVHLSRGSGRGRWCEAPRVRVIGSARRKWSVRARSPSPSPLCVSTPPAGAGEVYIVTSPRTPG